MGESKTSGQTAVVPVVLPAGPSGKTFLPLRTSKPPATVFLDRDYWAGYPNAAGVPTQPALKGYWHTGTDENGPGACNSDKGDPLFSIRDGVVEWAGIGGGSWGRIVVVRVVVEGRTYWARYGHVQLTGKTGQTVKVAAGQAVKAGQVVAFIGSGSWPCAHLHFDVFHTRPPSWDWWPLRYAAPETVTRYCTDPRAFLARLKAVQP